LLCQDISRALKEMDTDVACNFQSHKKSYVTELKETYRKVC
jgi:hypothetical protein